MSNADDDTWLLGSAILSTECRNDTIWGNLMQQTIESSYGSWKTGWLFEVITIRTCWYACILVSIGLNTLVHLDIQAVYFDSASTKRFSASSKLTTFHIAERYWKEWKFRDCFTQKTDIRGRLHPAWHFCTVWRIKEENRSAVALVIAYKAFHREYQTCLKVESLEGWGA